MANEYPIWWDKTITVYNKFVDPLTSVVKWFRHIIPDCFIDDTPQMYIAGNVMAQSSDVICRIRESENYKSKAEWQKLPNDQMSGYFTISQGDIVVFDEVDDEIADVSGHRATDLLSKYKDAQGAITVKRFSDNTGVGRVMPHYYITGD